MSYQQILNKLEKAVEKFNANIPKYQRGMLSAVMEDLRKLNTDGDKIKPVVENIKRIASIKNKMSSLLVTDQYKKAVKDFASSFREITTLQNEYWRSVEKDFSPKTLLKEIKNQNVRDTVGKLTEAGIGAAVGDKIADILTSNITTGGSYKQLTDQLRESLTDTDTQGTLSKYARQITTDSIHQYNAQYTQVISNDLGFEWYAWQGTEILTSREFCQCMVENRRYFHVSEVPAMLRAEDMFYTDENGNERPVRINPKTNLPYGFIPGTTVENFFVRRGGYNCGHQARPVSNDLVEAQDPAAYKRVHESAAYKAWAKGRPQKKAPVTPVDAQLAEMSPGAVGSIRALFDQGKTNAEIIAMGFNKNTVGVQRSKWNKEQATQPRPPAAPEPPIIPAEDKWEQPKNPLTAEQLLKLPQIQANIKKAFGSEGVNKDFIAKTENYKEGTYYRIEGTGLDYSGAGQGMYVGRDPKALKAFYDLENELTISTFTGQPKWLDITHPDNEAKFINEAELKYGKASANARNNLKLLAIEKGYDGIRYFDEEATGEEFVLFVYDKLKKVGQTTSSNQKPVGSSNSKTAVPTPAPAAGGKVGEIIKLLNEGKTTKEIIAMGYNKSTVGVQASKWKKETGGLQKPVEIKRIVPEVEKPVAPVSKKKTDTDEVDASAPVEIKFTPLETQEEAEKFAIKAGIAKKADFSGAKMDLTNHVIKALLKLKKKYGKSYNTVYFSHDSGDRAIASNARDLGGGFAFNLNTAMGRGLTMFKEVHEKAVKSGWNTSVGGEDAAESTIIHEFGHLLTIKKLDSRRGGRGKTEYKLATSTYSRTNNAEILAEMFVLMNSSDPAKRARLTKEHYDFFNSVSSVKIVNPFGK